MSDDFVQLSGESGWDALVHHYGLDIVDEDDFAAFCAEHGADQESDVWTLRRLYAEYESALSNLQGSEREKEQP